MPDGYDYGPLRTYEVTWYNRPPEIVQGHSVLFESAMSMFGQTSSSLAHFKIYGMFGGHWRMVLMGAENDVRTIRDITDQLAALEAMHAEGDDDRA